MTVHDWARVKAGIFHDFHNSWITHLKETLNGGLLPKGYFALGEQHAGRVVADILTLHDDEPRTAPLDRGGVAVADAPPQVGRKMVASENAAYRALRRTQAIRHASEHRLVALIEIVSPANKDRRQSVQDYVMPAAKPLTLAAYAAGDVPEAYVTHIAIAEDIPAMPLFLQAGRYVSVPFAETYDEAFRGIPAYWRNVLSQG